MSNVIKIGVILLLIFESVTVAYSQDLDDYNFEIFNNDYTIMPYYNTSRLKLNLTGTYDISYRPDKNTDIGLYGAYKKLGFGIGFGVFEGLKDETVSKVRFYDFRLNYYGRQIGVDGQFQFYRSFNVEESSDEVSDSLITETRPDQKLNNIGINIYYNFNESHSFKAIFNHTERQLKSNGAFLLGLSNVYTFLQAEGSYFTDTVKTKSEFTNYSRFTKLFSVMPIAGYQYTLIHKRLYVSPLLLVGAGVQFQQFPAATDEIVSDVQWVSKMVVSLPFGYNGEKVFYGFVFKGDYLKSSLKTLNLRFTLMSYSIFFGFRFM